MTKMNSKKRLAATFVALCMVFVVGAAYALGTGTLTLTGTINIEPTLSVVWGEDGVPASVTITQNDALDSDATISGHGTETLTFTAAFGGEDDEIVIEGVISNVGGLDAELEEWDPATIAAAINAQFPTASDFEVAVSGFTAVQNVLIEAGDYRAFEFTITLAEFDTDWDFTYDVLAPPNTTGPVSITFTLELDYDAV